jgi:hypothetical protein
MSRPSAYMPSVKGYQPQSVPQNLQRTAPSMTRGVWR